MDNQPQQLQLVEGGSAKYCMDSSVFFSFWIEGRRFYITHYKPLWDFIDERIQSRLIQTTEEVYIEIKDHKHPDFKKWIQTRRHLLNIEDDDEVIELADKIINENQKIYFTKRRNGADPFLVAYAKIHNLILITEEKAESEHNLKAGSCPAIPNLCETYGVECVDVLGFCEKEGYQLAPVSK